MVNLSHAATSQVTENVRLPQGDAGGQVNVAGELIPLSIEEHRELGRELTAATERLRSLCDLLVHVYGGNNLAAFSFLKAMEAMDRLKWDLQHQATQDLPGHANDVFYR